MPRLRQLLLCCSLWLVGTIVLAGPGMHLLAPCEHDGHTTSSSSSPEDRLGQDDSCPICSFHSQAQAPAPDAEHELITPAVERLEQHDLLVVGLLPAPSRLPRAPPIG